jgi:hypothetical protein
MDYRTRRLGQHTAQTRPAWAIQALGRVPADPVSIRAWEDQAAAIAAYRETYGYDHPDDPIGPEHSHQAPDQRAAWHEAFAVLGPANGPDVRAMTDGQLWLTRDAYTAQTRWAPPHTGEELRLARIGSTAADLAALRAAAEADGGRKTGDLDCALQQDKLAASYRAFATLYRERETALTRATTEREQWDHATNGSRRLAIAADAELHRRHPSQKIEPLRTAEPAYTSHGGHERAHPTPGQEIPQVEMWIRDLRFRYEQFPITTQDRRVSQVSIEDVRGRISGAISSPWKAFGPDAILQPPKPSIKPATQILQPTANLDLELEAGG